MNSSRPSTESVSVRIICGQGGRLAAIALLVGVSALTGCRGGAGAGPTTSLGALEIRGDADYKGEQFAEAASSYAKYIEGKPGDKVVRAKLGAALLRAGQPEAAVTHLRVAYSQSPTNDAILDDLADALVKSNQKDEAFRLLRARCADRGSTGDWLRLGRAGLRMADTDTARASLLTAAKVDGGRSVEPQIALSDFYAAINDRPNAVKRLRMAYFIDAAAPDVVARVAKLGVTAGPTFGLPPEELGR